MEIYPTTLWLLSNFMKYGSLLLGAALLISINSNAMYEADAKKVKCSGGNFSANIQYAISISEGMELKKAELFENGELASRNFISNEFFNTVVDKDGEIESQSISYPDQFVTFVQGALIKLSVESLYPGKDGKVSGKLVIEPYANTGAKTKTIALSCVATDVEQY